MHISTILRREHDGNIPIAERGAGGPGGKWTEYPDGTVAELFAAYCLMHGQYGTEADRAFLGGKMPNIPPSAITAILKYMRVFADFADTKEEWPGRLSEADVDALKEVSYRQRKGTASKMGCSPEIPKWLLSMWAERYLYAMKKLNNPG